MFHHQIVARSVLAAALVGISLSPALATDVTISPEQLSQLDIGLSRVKLASATASAVLPATVVPASNARITAAAPFAGTILQVSALPGQTVRKGDPLVTVLSRELVEAHGNLAQQEADLQKAAATAKWKRDLVDKKILSAALAEEAEAHVKKLEAAIAAQGRTFALGGIKVEDQGRYTITAPADGKVVIASVQPGGQVEAMAAAVTISTNDDLWVEVQLPADLVQQVKPGDGVDINGVATGTVLSVGGTLDPVTRSATLLATVPDGSPLIAGQLVSVTLQRPAEMGSYEVPASAVTWIGNAHAVFRRSDKGFSLVPVELKGKSRTAATIAGSLQADQEIAVRGLPQLEAILNAE
jgi:cobalt-zinc-cadmium efflux system membrane fusion protein